MEETSFPLHWPHGRPRAKARERARFGERAAGARMGAALDALENEIRRLGAKNPVFSTNVQTRADGRPYANRGIAPDPGAAVYFTLNGKRMAFACDIWDRVEDNLWAIAKHIDAMRGQQRWGVGSVEQAFAGYVALEHRTGPSCWETLGLPANATEAQIIDAWRTLAKTAHPDKGGSAEAWNALNQAKDIPVATARAAGK
jgi:hypothetical protein